MTSLHTNRQLTYQHRLFFLNLCHHLLIVSFSISISNSLLLCNSWPTHSSSLTLFQHWDCFCLWCCQHLHGFFLVYFCFCYFWIHLLIFFHTLGPILLSLLVHRFRSQSERRRRSSGSERGMGRGRRRRRRRRRRHRGVERHRSLCLSTRK